jgi:outer membrane lipoprotein-sorting protein
MRRAVIVRILCWALLGGAIGYGQDFSADVVNTSNKDGAKSGRVYVKRNKMRIDRAAAGSEAVPLILVDMDSHMVTIMDATNHAYMKAELGPEQGLSFFRAKDANNACPDLQKMASFTGCKKAGNEAVNGRLTVKYTGNSEDGKPGFVWVDPEVNFVVKWQTKPDETGELRNIKVAPQAESLFDIPSGYHNAVPHPEGRKEDKPETREEKEAPRPTTPQ